MPTDPIKHVVVLMLENHSFDQMLGAFRSEFPDLEGVDPANPGTNRDKDGQDYSAGGDGSDLRAARPHPRTGQRAAPT